MLVLDDDGLWLGLEYRPVEEQVSMLRARPLAEMLAMVTDQRFNNWHRVQPGALTAFFRRA